MEEAHSLERAKASAHVTQIREEIVNEDRFILVAYRHLS